MPSQYGMILYIIPYIATTLISNPRNTFKKMESNQDLYRQAILDAKAVRETAMAAARTTLAEHFEPKIREMMSQKLSEVLEEEVEENIEESMDDNS
jgi:hypothetical protein